MSIVVIRFKNGTEFSFKCDEATFKTDSMTGELSGYSFKGFYDKKPLFFLDLKMLSMLIRFCRKKMEEGEEE